jgi:hypothetical protein
MCSKAKRVWRQSRAGTARFQSSSLESAAKGEDLSMRSMWWKRGSDGSWLFKAPHSPRANLRHRNTAVTWTSSTEAGAKAAYSTSHARN